MAGLSVQQSSVLKARRQLLREFTKREWLSLFVWSGFGALAAGLVRLVLSASFQAYLTSRYLPSPTFGDRRLLLPYLITAVGAFFLGIALRIPGFLWRGLRSWWAGVTSGLALLPFTSTFVLLTMHSPSVHWRLTADFGIVAASFLLGFVLYLKAEAHAEDTFVEEDLRVSSRTRSLAGTQLPESDDPITTWREDALRRASLVESICVKLMISKSPVVALFGEFGSGKTSILNLLREHLADKAIVVSFSTWLPGSQETLTAYLLSDIANECHKQYIVPGLRKSAQRLAKALGRNVPLLRDYLESLPVATQKDDIDSVKAALGRLPERVIVLLDELDRMEKQELVTLLKMIRGITTLPNVSFVCAGDRRTIVEVAKGNFDDKNNAYFEKFFPVSIQIPEANPEALRRAGTERLVAAFRRRDWFENESQVETFRKHIDRIWDQRIAPFCRNLRATGLLANDVGAAAAPLRREVHPVDLTLIELLRRFKPAIYQIVSRSSVALTGGESILRGGQFHLDEDKERIKRKLIEDIRQAVPGEEERAQVEGVLGELFPLFAQNDGQSRLSRSQRQADEESEKRISQPGIFPAYFRYELPEAIFSSVEMDALLRRMGAATKGDDRERAFLETLDSMEKGSLRRDDFLRKLAEAATKSMPLPIGKALVHAAMRAADKYAYDTLPAFGEAGHVLRIVLRISERVRPAERAVLLSDCVLGATVDTMAFRVLKDLTGPHKDFNLNISLAQLYPSFTKRMSKKYGRDVDAATVDLSSSDPWAFDFWGKEKLDEVTIDPEDRAIQYDFWLRYIGNSRSRFAHAFRHFFLPPGLYSEDPTALVENKISVAHLKKLYEQLPEDGTLTEVDRQTLRTVRRFLDGEFRNGISSPDELYAHEGAAGA
jgi:hypothetical protein